MNIFRFYYLGFAKTENCELHFGIRYDGCNVKSVNHVPSWRICSMICFETPKCKPLSCWLKRSKCNITDSDNRVSGEAKCGNL